MSEGALALFLWRNMETRTINEQYAEIGADLIATEDSLIDIANSSATIIYLSSTHKKTSGGKVVKAECEKISDKYKWGIPCDFTITVFEPNCEGMTEEQMRILIFHELLHIGIEEKNGKEVYSIVPHDLEDFRTIIRRFGVDWSR
jgi:hypothetical protein